MHSGIPRDIITATTNHVIHTASCSLAPTLVMRDHRDSSGSRYKYGGMEGSSGKSAPKSTLVHFVDLHVLIDGKIRIADRDQSGRCVTRDRIELSARTLDGIAVAVAFCSRHRKRVGRN